MIAPVFVDTNVFLYVVDLEDGEKHRAAREWCQFLWKSRLGRTSFQVLQEYYVNCIRKWPSRSDGARQDIRDLLLWNPLRVSGAILEQGWRLQDRYRLAFWDSLILSAAKSMRCGYLLSEDFQTNQNFEGITVISPFSSHPSFLRAE